MKKIILVTKLLLCAATATLAQSVAINNSGAQPDASAILDVSSTSKGLLIPRMTAAQRTAIATPATGLQVYQTDSTKGFYYFDGTAWIQIGAGNASYTAGTGIDITGNALSAKNTSALWNANQLQGKDISTTAPLNGQTLLYSTATNKWVPSTLGAGASGWALTGNAGVNAAANFIGTTDAQPFIGKVNGLQVFSFSPGSSSTIIGTQASQATPAGGSENHIIGYKAGFSNTSFDNHFDGFQAGYSNTSGYANQFIGYKAGYNTTTGTDNMFIGVQAGFSNTTGSNSHFIGHGAGFSNTSGTNNHFSGFNSGEYNTTGSNNHFEGNNAGFSNTTGSNNHFDGNRAGYINTTGSRNYFSGFNAGYNNITGNDNFYEGYNAGYSSTTTGSCFIGNNAGKANTTGYNNFFVGNYSGLSNTTGSYNSFLGNDAGYSNQTGGSNVFVGTGAGRNNVTGSHNVFLGNVAGYNELGSNKLYISNSQTESPLIYGEFDNSKVKINGSQEIEAITSAIPVLTLKGFDAQNAVLKFASTVNPNHSWVINVEPYNDGSMYFGHDDPYTIAMRANGDIITGGSIYASSDKTLKKNITSLKNPLQKLLKLGGYTYNWIESTKSKAEQIGLLAQEVEAEFPQLVTTDKAGKKAVAYSNMVPVLVEAIKEQQTMIDGLKSANEQSKKNMDELKAANEQLKNDMAAIKAKLPL